MANRLKELFTRFRVGTRPSDRSELPIVEKKDEIVSQFGDSSDMYQIGQFNRLRQVSYDRSVLYDAYDDMKTDSIIAAALELYADDATQADENGRIIWAESEDEEITKAANRLLDIFEIPERAWKHIHQACCYGDYYLKLYRKGEIESDAIEDIVYTGSAHIVNDVVDYKGHKELPQYEEYVEDVEDPASIFDLRVRGKIAGFVEADRSEEQSVISLIHNSHYATRVEDIKIYRPDRFVHILLGENLSRYPEQLTIDIDANTSVDYTVARGKSILQDVYPVQKELQLLEDTLLINRLTRSPLIRLMEIEVGDMPKKEVNNYQRRIKQLIEQHVSMDKDTGSYKSYNAPGPIDNVIYIPVRNGKGHIEVNNLGGDVNVRDIADVDYFKNKRDGALKVPRGFLGDDMDGSGLSNGGSLTRLSIRYARTVRRIQTAYIRAITHLLNLFFLDRDLDYANKFVIKMTSPSTQEDLERNELINGKIDLVSNIMDLTTSLEGDTQKKILNYLIANVMAMPEVAAFIKEDGTPSKDVQIEGGGSGGGPSSDIDIDFNDYEDKSLEDVLDNTEESSSGEVEGGFTDSDFAEFEDEI